MAIGVIDKNRKMHGRFDISETTPKPSEPVKEVAERSWRSS
jgi:hypothetical protein